MAGNYRLGKLLVDSKIIDRAALNAILEKQMDSGKKLGELLIREGLIKEQVLLEALEFQTGIPRIALGSSQINSDASKLIPESVARKHLLIPFKEERGKLLVAMHDPLNILAVDDVQLATGKDVTPFFAARDDILNAIDRYYGKENADKAIEELRKQINPEQITELDEATLAEINNAPLVKLVNTFIRNAVRTRASDVHIEPYDRHVRIRFRVDGDLQEIMKLDKNTQSGIITRLKIMGNMDITEKRNPQEGRVEMEIDGKEVDLRLSSLPTIYGEKIVIRLLNKGEQLLSKKDLGFNEKNMKRFESIIACPNGIILVTGPTGSGKTTTLYTVLQEINKINCNIITVEDPVEYRIDGINQVQVNTKAGLTFANSLRSILRQDPDIIMIGEIRDAETAQIAVRAAITGHLVLSTMHTNDTAATVARLVDMGVEPFLISTSLVGVIAQRLVRRICTQCKQPYEASDTEKRLLDVTGPQTLYKGKGCHLCGKTGYLGRTAITETMVVDDHVKRMIDERQTAEALRKTAVAHGMETLRYNCTQLVLNGLTTVEELIKITYGFEKGVQNEDY